MSQIILLMTATIAPGNCPRARFDVETRLKQYLRAFNFYCKKLCDEACFDRLVFCDNSGYCLDCFREIIPATARDRIELVSLLPQDFSPELGKGYNEALLIDLVMKSSRFIRECDENTLIVKVTGRYSILNINHFMRYFRRENPQLHVDIKDHNLYAKLGLKWHAHHSDTRLLAFTKSFYEKNLAGRYAEISDPDAKPLERFYYNLYLQLKGSANLSFRSRQDLFIDGVDGHLTRILSIEIPLRWQKSFGYLKSCVRTALRYLFPSFWC